MKKTLTQLLGVFFIGIFCFAFQSNASAQLVGGNVYPINGTENAPTSFQSLKTAVTYLTANGVSGTGQAVLEFQSGYDAASDTAAGTSISIPNITGTSATLGITVRPGAGFTTKISISISGAGSIILNGAKYITFDGRQGGSGATGLTLQNGGVNTTIATSTVQFINDAQFCTLRNLSLTNANTNSASAAGTVLFGTTSGSTGNSNNTITNNVFGPVGGSLTSCSYHIISSGTAGFPNASNTITNNEITNFGFRGMVATTGTGNNWTITGNSIYSSLAGTGTHRAINFLTGSGSGHNISYNFIGGRAASCGGAAYTCAAFFGIDVNFDTLNTSSVQGNVIRNFTNTITATGTAFVGINISGGKINLGTVDGNVIGSQSDTGSIKLHSTTTGAATIFNYGILVGSTAIGTLNIQNNSIGSISINPIGVAASNSFLLRAISNESALLTGSTIISNNKVGGTVANSIKSTGTGRPVAIQGIVSFGSATVNADSVRNFTGATTSGSLVGLAFFDGVTGQTYNSTNNIVHNLSALTNTTSITGQQVTLSVANVVATVGITGNTFTNFTTTGNAAMGGMTLSNGSFSGTGINGSVSNNTISNFTGGAGAAAVVFGIQAATTVTTTMDVTNNTITNLTGATTSITNTSTGSVYGIGWPSAAGGTLNISQNNINTLTCTGAGATHVIGIGVFGGGNVFRNRIYGLTNPNAFSIGTIKGIVMRSTGTMNAINNQITLTGITSDVGVYGIENNSASTQVNAYYNSIYIGGTAQGGATNFSAPIFRNGASVNSIIDARNNILCNVRTGGTGPHCIYINNSTTPATGWDSTGGKNNYNLLIIPAGGSITGVWNGVSMNFAAWKTTTLCDYLSPIAENTAAITNGSQINTNNFFTSAASGNLNINTSNSEAWFSKGLGNPISTVSNDYNGNARSTTVAGGSVCLGSHEFITNAAPPSADASGAPANSTTTTYSFGGRIISSIAWGPGGIVPTSVDLKKYSGATPPSSSGYNTGNGYLDVAVSGGSGYTYDFGWFYDPTCLGTISGDTNIVVAKSENGGLSYSPFLIYGTGASQFERNSGIRYIVVYGLTDFSLFALADIGTPLPVELASFTSSIDKKNVTLNWSTSSESNNTGFDIERKTSTETSWKKIGNVAGAGNSNTIKNYSFEDNNLNTGNYNYRLKQIDNNGNYKYYNLSNEVIIGIPVKFDLSQNYPNPFNPSTKINYDLPFDSKVSIKIFDMTGREVVSLVNQSQTAGYHTVSFNASNLSSGTYFYRINADGGNQSFTKTLKMTLIK